jgi:hypothetical protein
MSDETFDEKILCSITPFTVIWTATQVVKKTTKAGGMYEKKVIVVENVSLSEPLSVEVTKEVYDRLRLMSKQGINTFAATEGVANEKGWRKVIVSGAKIFHEGITA